VATISIDQLTKIYPNGFKAVDSLDLEVAEGEFVVLVGPSGCGKTTALRMVAGLEEITAGTLRIGDRAMNEVPARDRDIAMVFQNYALYPHMTVEQNIGFALKLRRLPKAEIKRKVAGAARILGLTSQLRLRPAELSGGQRQRVAMGRAIVREPVAFLMDEPLSNLDAKLRVQMRAEVSRIQRHLGVATLYVTHDQTEAMTMGDRVAVLSDGVLQQCDRPQSVYDHPDNIFVAAFIGSPAMNLYRASLTVDGGEVVLGSQRVTLSREAFSLRPALESYRGREVVVGIRPEHLFDAAGSPQASRLESDVDLVEALGSELLVHFHMDAERVHAEAAELPPEEAPAARRRGGTARSAAEAAAEAEAAEAGEFGEALRAASVARLDPRSDAKPGQRMTFSVDSTRMHFFDVDTSQAIWR
jgi:multiple sugar transport system ATP-binding protein